MNIRQKMEACWTKATNKLIFPGLLMWIALYVVLAELNASVERQE